MFFCVQAAMAAAIQIGIFRNAIIQKISNSGYLRNLMSEICSGVHDPDEANCRWRR